LAVDYVASFIDRSARAQWFYIPEMIALSSSDFQSHSATYQVELAAHFPIVECDRVQLQQVILNLLRNALDAMSEVNDRPRRLIVKTDSGGPDM
jgi:C4-dicarboxylate-specific signal transduction histidine kinase